MHGGEKVLYIRGEVAYNTARYWFCFFVAGASGLGIGEGPPGGGSVFVGGVASGVPVELPADSAGAGKRRCGHGLKTEAEKRHPPVPLPPAKTSAPNPCPPLLLPWQCSEGERAIRALRT